MQLLKDEVLPIAEIKQPNSCFRSTFTLISRFYTLSYLALIAACTNLVLIVNRLSMAITVSIQLDDSSATYEVKHEIDGIYKATRVSTPPTTYPVPTLTRLSCLGRVIAGHLIAPSR